MQLESLTVLRATGVQCKTVQPFTAASSSSRTRRVQCTAVAKKLDTKLRQVILTKNVEGLGTEGQMVGVARGYWRNYLLPKGLALMATEELIEQRKKQKEAEERIQMEERAKARALAGALFAIGRFVIKRKVGPEGQLLNSVTAQDVVNVIRKQIGRELEKDAIELPVVKAPGVYDVNAKLYPGVMGRFQVEVKKSNRDKGEEGLPEPEDTSAEV